MTALAPIQTSSSIIIGRGIVGRSNTDGFFPSIGCFPDEIVTFEPTRTLSPKVIPPFAFI